MNMKKSLDSGISSVNDRAERLGGLVDKDDVGTSDDGAEVAALSACDDVTTQWG